MPVNEVVPFSVTNFDYIALIPSQFLPFEKIDGPSWYVKLIGMQNRLWWIWGHISAIVGYGIINFKRAFNRFYFCKFA